MKVTVVGGGVIGLSAAFRCVQRGGEVTVVDPTPGRGASWAAGGMLAPVAEAYRGEESITRFGVESARMWPSFVKDLVGLGAGDCGYTRRGTLVVARDDDDRGQLAELYELQNTAGLAAERVSSREARRLEPALSPTIRGALWLADDHQVDNRSLLAALHDACVRSGVGFLNERACMIGTEWVATESGTRLAGDAVVVCTGAWPPPIMIDSDAAGVRNPIVPVRPVKGQIVRVKATSSAVFPSVTVRGLDVYVVPRSHGEIVIGATSEEKGFDTTTTAGALLDLLRHAWELLPGLSEAEFVETTAGLRPATPDNAPILGRLGLDGPIIAMGHYRHGLLLAPATAEVVASLAFGEPVDPELARLVAPFGPERFDQLRDQSSWVRSEMSRVGI